MIAIRTGAVCACLVALLTADAPCVWAQQAKVAATRLFSAMTTASGQPITLPKSGVEVIAWMYEIPAGAKLPVHRHPSPRYAYVLAGTLRVATADQSRTWD